MAVVGQQAGVGALLGNPPLVQHNDEVGVPDCAQTMGNGDRGALGGQTRDGLLDEVLGFGIDRGGRLIENQNWRVFEYRPGNRQTLLLTGRELDAAFTDQGVIPRR